MLLRALMVTTALVTAAGLTLVSLKPAYADGGVGGFGGGGTPGGAGGTGFTGNPGQDGTAGNNGGGGGGGGAGGGFGGAGGANLAVGAAGGGGGGTGGVNGNGTGTATITNTSPLAGAVGGNGGNFDPTGGGGGGGGGAGGYGAIVTGGGSSSNISSIGGGKGGNGGIGDLPDAGGSGGDGGVGVQFTATGATFTNSGTVTGGNGGTGGTGGVVNGNPGAGGAGIVGAGLTIINSSIITGGLSGDGVTRANAITFTGGTNVLQLQAGSTITGNVVAFSNADTFQLGGTANASFDASTIGASAQYQGFGAFQKIGSSTWTLTGTNTSTMPWAINAGTLLVNGNLTGATMTVNNGGTLGGTGSVGSTSVNAGGTFAPGNGTPGTSMSVSSLALTSGAVYAVQINPATSSFATSLVGTSLGGATVNAIFANGSYISKQYTILSSILPIGGTFNPTIVNTNLPANFVDSLSYDATHAYLNLTLNFLPPTAPNFGGGLPGNQNAVGNAITNFFNTTGSIPLVFGTLTPNGLTQISGETATGSQQTTFDAMGLFMGLLTDPFMNRTGSVGSPPSSGYADENAYAARSNPTDAFAMFTKAPPVAPTLERRWSVWAAGFGGSQSTSGNTLAGSNNTTSNIAGTAVGADYLISPNTIAGFALAGGGTNFSVANGGSGRSDLFQFGAYVRHNQGPAYLSAALAYGWQDITTNRTVTVAGLDQLRAEFNANAFSGRLEGGYRFVSPATLGIGITPYAAAQFVTFDLPAYMEQAISGTNNFALGYGARNVTDARSELGIRTDRSWLVTDGVLTLRGRLAWAHDYDPDRSIAATFQALPGASFVVNGAAQAADSALTTASIEMKWKNGWSAAATFEGEFSDVTNAYAGKGVIRYQW